VNFSGTREDVPGRETPFFFALGGLSNKQIIFYFIGTLTNQGAYLLRTVF